LPSSSLQDICSLILFPLNLPPVSKTPVKLVAKFAAGVVDTGGNFAAGVVDTVANLLPVSLIPVVHLDLRISLRNLQKI
jgi:hypothetical protein